MNPVFDPLQRKMVSGPEAGQNVDVDGFEVSFSGSSTGGVYNAAAGLSLTGNTFSVAAGYRMNTSSGTVNQDRFFSIETVSGTSVTLQAGHAYIINATTSAGITLNCESFAANTFGLEGHATIYTANAGYVQQGANVYLADPLEPDAVNNCTIRFHGGSATVSVEDYFGGYIVLSGGTGSGSLPYGLASAGSQYIGFNASLNGSAVNLSGSTANGEKHIVGNGYANTILTGAVNCGTSKFTVANLGLNNVQVTGGVMTLGDAFIPSGSTVAVAAGGIVIENVTGSGGVIDFGNTSNHIMVKTNETARITGATIANHSATATHALDVYGLLRMSNGALTGNVGGDGCALFVSSGGTAIISNTIISGNVGGANGTIAVSSGGIIEFDNCPIREKMVAWGSIALSGCSDTLSNWGYTGAGNGTKYTFTDCVMSGGIQYAGVGGSCTFYGSNCMFGKIQLTAGTSADFRVTISGNAVLDLTGNNNTEIFPPNKYGNIFEGGTATILYTKTISSDGSTVASSGSYALGGMTVPTIGNTNVVNLGGTHVTVSSGTATASNAIFSGGFGTNGGGIAVTNGAEITLTGCTVTGCTAQSYGKGMYLSRGNATLSNCTLENNGDTDQPEIVVRASSTLTLSGGSVRRIDLYGGTASIAGTVTLGAVFATANTDGGPLTISGGATIDLTNNTNPTPIAPGGTITFKEGGATVKVGDSTASSSYMMDNVTLPAGAKLTSTNAVDLSSTINSAVVSSLGSAYNVSLNGGATKVFGVVNSVSINYAGILIVSSGGTATNIIANGSAFRAFSGCLASNIEINSGLMDIYGTANDATINSGGVVYVKPNGVGNNVTVNSGGALYVSSGGTALLVTSNTGAVVTVFEGGYITYKE